MMPKADANFSVPIGSLDCGDPLSQILNSIGISGSLLLKEEYCSPWAVAIPHSRQLNTLLNTTSYIHVATFHLVERAVERNPEAAVCAVFSNGITGGIGA